MLPAIVGLPFAGAVALLCLTRLTARLATVLATAIAGATLWLAVFVALAAAPYDVFTLVDDGAVDAPIVPLEWSVPWIPAK